MPKRTLKLFAILLNLLIIFTLIPSAWAQRDSDGDGIEDSQDACPNSPGPRENNGCPDSDGEGVHDGLDACPIDAGPADNGGCPRPPDRDTDGLADTADACPDVAGPSDNGGCPRDQATEQPDVDRPADSDGDGFSDEEDRCPSDNGNIRGCNLPTIPPDDPCSLATRDAVYVNIRLDPSLEGEIGGRLEFMAIYPILGEFENEEGRWYGLESGWIYEEVVRTGGRDCAQLPELDENRQPIGSGIGLPIIPAGELHAWIECPINTVIYFAYGGSSGQQYKAQVAPGMESEFFEGTNTGSVELSVNQYPGNYPTELELTIFELDNVGKETAIAEIMVDITCGGMEQLTAWVDCPDNDLIHFIFIGYPNRSYQAVIANSIESETFHGGYQGTIQIPKGSPFPPNLSSIEIKIMEMDEKGASVATTVEGLVDLTCGGMNQLTAWVECPNNDLIYFSFVGSPNSQYQAAINNVIESAPFQGGHQGTIQIPKGSPLPPDLSSIEIKIMELDEIGKSVATSAEVLVDLSCGGMNQLTAWVECPNNSLIYFSFVGSPSRQYRAVIASGIESASFQGGQEGTVQIPAGGGALGPGTLNSIELKIVQLNPNGSATPVTDVMVDLTCGGMEQLTAWIECPDNNTIHYSFVGSPNRTYQIQLGNLVESANFSGGQEGTLDLPQDTNSIQVRAYRLNNNGSSMGVGNTVNLDLTCAP